MKNTIARRVADFLKRYPPFDRVDTKALLKIAEQVSIVYFDKGQVVYKKNQALHQHFYLIHKGAVSLLKDIKKRDVLDTFDEGDVFGLRPLFAKENYAISAVAEEESILYAVPIDVFKPLAEGHKAIGNYLIEIFASNTENPYTKEHHIRFFSEETAGKNPADQLYELQPLRYKKKVVTAKPHTKIKEVAQRMRDLNIGSIVIEEHEHPIGIVTDKDLRVKVATGQNSIDEPVQHIMSSPVLCYPANATIAQAQISMMKHKIGHLCITADGTPNSAIIGLVSEHDMTVMKGSNPSVLMKAIKRSTSTKDLKRIREKIRGLLEGYIYQNIPLTLFSKLIFELNDATIKRIITRCIAKMSSPPPVKFAWISLGSQGRKEQLLQTDQDNALIFENVASSELESVRTYFLKLAKKVNKRLDIVGFEFCTADMMAKNPRWCLSLDEWKAQFTQWTRNTGNDEILLSSIFFDFDISYGEASLSQALAEHSISVTKNNRVFFTKLAMSAMRNPSPLGFFRQFLVEKNGEHKDFFDLKKRGLRPLVDAARLLILEREIKQITNTAERFEKLADIAPEHSELYLSCSYAYKALLKFRTKNGLFHHNSGQFIQLDALTKEEKLKIKRCFKTITTLQDHLKIRFNIGQLL